MHSGSDTPQTFPPVSVRLAWGGQRRKLALVKANTPTKLRSFGVCDEETRQTLSFKESH